MAINEEYSVEFDDALLDLIGWKNPRYNGSKLTGQKINEFNTGDISYGKNPVVEREQEVIFVGNTVIGTAENPKVITLEDHSFLEINKIIVVNPDETINTIERTAENSEAFNRFITGNLLEGDKVNFRLLDFSTQTNLKQDYFVKFNRGLLMKVYTYTPTLDPFVNDGVFGGIGVSMKNKKEAGGSDQNLSGSGMFGFGQNIVVTGDPTSLALTEASQSKFASSSIEGEPGIFTVNPFPAEMANYSDGAIIHRLDVAVGAKSTIITPDTITLHHFYKEWVFFDILRGIEGNHPLGGNKYFVTFEKGKFGISNNKQESISTAEITHPQVDDTYNVNGSVFTEFMQQADASSMVSADLEARNVGHITATSLKSNRFFEANIPQSASNSSIAASFTGPVKQDIIYQKSYTSVSKVTTVGYTCSFYYPFSQHQLSVLRPSPTVVINLDKEDELPDGLGEKGFILLPENSSREVKGNLDFYLEKAGLIGDGSKSELKKAPEDGL